MMITFIRTFIVYACGLFTNRCMGKTGLSSTDPFQITIMLLIAELAAMPVSSPEISLLNGVAAIFMILFLYALSGFLSCKSEWFKKFINGRPSILIDNGAINFKEMKRSNVTLTDLMEMLRIQDCPFYRRRGIRVSRNERRFQCHSQAGKKASDPGRSPHSCGTGNDALHRPFRMAKYIKKIWNDRATRKICCAGK